jgi:hypothetical protein
MSDRLATRIGGVELKSPLIATAAEHLIEADGVRRALAAGGYVRRRQNSDGDVRQWPECDVPQCPLYAAAFGA